MIQPATQADPRLLLRKLNELIQQVNRQGSFVAEPPLMLADDPTGAALYLDEVADQNINYQPMAAADNPNGLFCPPSLTDAGPPGFTPPSGQQPLYVDSAGFLWWYSGTAWQNLNAAATRFVWRYDAAVTMADPGTGELRFNNAAVASTTQLALSRTTDGGADVTGFLVTLRAGDVVTVQDLDNAAKWARYTLSAAPTNNTTWFLLPLTYVASAGTAPNVNEKLLVTFSQAGGGGGGGGSGTAGYLAAWASATTLGNSALADFGDSQVTATVPMLMPSLQVNGPMKVDSVGIPRTAAAGYLQGIDGSVYSPAAGTGIGLQHVDHAGLYSTVHAFILSAGMKYAILDGANAIQFGATGTAPGGWVVTGGLVTTLGTVGARRGNVAVHNSAAQTIPSGQHTILVFNAAPFDTDGYWSAGTPNRLTVPAGKAGKYHVWLTVTFAFNATGTRACHVKLNGTTYKSAMNMHTETQSGIPLGISTSITLHLAVGEFVEANVYQGSGGDLGIVADDYSPNFGMDLVGE